MIGERASGKFWLGQVILLLLSFIPLASGFSQVVPSSGPNPDKCGFPSLWQQWERNAPEALEQAVRRQNIFAQTRREFYLSPSGRFQIEYQPQELPQYDRNQNGVPDYVELAGVAFDRAWQVEVEQLGFRPPPSVDGGIRQPYPVRITPLGTTYGITYFEEEIPDRPGLNFTSFIEVNSNFDFVWWYPEPVSDPILRDSLALAVTAAHEFHHALQLGYRIWTKGSDPDNPELNDLWFIESTATLMEELVADQVNDYYQYLPSFYSRTDQSLLSDVQGNRLYGGVLLPLMLSEWYGPEIVRQVWEQIEQEIAVLALAHVLNGRQSSLETEMLRLAQWMYFSGQRSIPDRFFSEGAFYPTLNPLSLATPPEQQMVELYAGALPPLSFRVFSFFLSPGQGAVLQLQAQEQSDHWSGQVITQEEQSLPAFPAAFSYRIPAALLQPEMAISIHSGFWSQDAQAGTVGYQVLAQSVPVQQGEDILVYPNPVRAEQNAIQVAFLNLPAEASLWIGTPSGRTVRELRPGPLERQIFWNLENQNGRPVASGVYLYRIRWAGGEKTGKLLIVR